MEREEQLSIFGQLDLLCEGPREREEAKRRVSPSALKLFDRLPPQFTALCKAYDPLTASLPPLPLLHLSLPFMKISSTVYVSDIERGLGCIFRR